MIRGVWMLVFPPRHARNGQLETEPLRGVLACFMIVRHSGWVPDMSRTLETEKEKYPKTRSNSSEWPISGGFLEYARTGR